MAKLAKWSPFKEIMDVRDDFDRLVDRIFNRDLDLWEGGRVPAIDVYEEGDNIIVKAEVPGVKKEDISVSLNGDILTISGKSQEEKEVKKENFYRKEIRSGTFSRSITLPAQIDKDKVKASYKDGVLQLTLPKSPEEKKKEVKIKVE
ncbi:MAG TPA: Hsp20/alpha crystallin family protein [Candidatus Ratteibacteria bacterium]|nr:Hsp20/alpha crystallin family protein [Candidatus Ratteibacteria bacterium]